MHRRTAAACAALIPLALAACSSTTTAPTPTPDMTANQTTSHETTPATMSAEIDRYLAARHAEFDAIPTQRKARLDEIAAWVRDARDAGRTPQLTFVCTHNSRRSHMAQLWAQTAADAHNLNLRTFSGGTETTAFNPRAVAALERAGFDIDKGHDKANPRYTVRWTNKDAPRTNTATSHRAVCFSKVYNDPANPRQDFAAVMVCDDADENCPVVPGAEQRFAITYTDPKASDGTPAEAATYDERCAQIAREMAWMIARAAG